MGGRGTWRDNVFVERVWRSVKYERVYLNAYDSVSAASTSTGTTQAGHIRALIASKLLAQHR
jgi:putative transposase